METDRPSSDEIDLLHLLVKVYRFFLQNWVSILVIVVVCVGLSWISFKSATPAYESKMVVRSEFLSESNATQIIENLQQLADEGNDSLFAAKLGLTIPEAHAVKQLSVKSAISSGATPSDLDKTAFLIDAMITDASILPKLQRGLISFFDNLEFLKARVSEKKKGYQNLISQIDNEIAGLGDQPAGNDQGSLYLAKTPKGKDKDTKGGKSTVQFDPSTVRVYMYKDRIEAEEKLTFLRGVELIEGFTFTRSAVYPNRMIYLASGVSSGILISLLLLGVKTLHRLTKKYPA